MREIKFRAYKDFEMFDQVYFDVKGWFYYSDGGEETRLGDHAQKMQFTGLKDKNGKDIYEGDIIQYQSFVIDKDQIIFKNGAFYAKEEETLLSEFTDCDLEVIGNVWENPELLKQEEEKL